MISAFFKSIFIFFSNVTHESIMLNRYDETLLKVEVDDEADKCLEVGRLRILSLLVSILEK